MLDPTPLLAAVCPLPPAIRYRLLHLWHAMVHLAREATTPTTDVPPAPHTEAYATTPVY